MSEDLEQPEWGRLIEQRRNDMRPKLSARKAATLASLSEGRWRQITRGFQAVGGVQVPVRGPAETLARMAQVVGVTADELEQAGRPDAAEELRRVARDFPGDDHPDEILDGLAVYAELEAWMSTPREEWPGPPPAEALSFWDTDQLLEAIRLRVEVWELRARQAWETIANQDALITSLRLDGSDGVAEDAAGSANEADADHLEAEEKPPARRRLKSVDYEAARDVGRPGSVEKARGEQDKAGEPEADDPNDLNPR